MPRGVKLLRSLLTVIHLDIGFICGGQISMSFISPPEGSLALGVLYAVLYLSVPCLCALVLDKLDATLAACYRKHET